MKQHDAVAAEPSTEAASAPETASQCDQPQPELAGVATVLKRGARKLCPHCGEAGIYDERHDIRSECPACGLKLLPNPGDAFGFMYLSAAVITGLYIAGFYFTRMWTFPWPVRIAYLAVGLALMIGLTRRRTGVAVALDYLTRVRWGETNEMPPPRVRMHESENSRPRGDRNR